jgi:hypothetical protein
VNKSPHSERPARFGRRWGTTHTETRCVVTNEGDGAAVIHESGRSAIPSARVAPGPGTGSRPRALRPGPPTPKAPARSAIALATAETRPPLERCRCPRVYELARGRICHTAQNASGDSPRPTRGDGRRADESLWPRSAFAEATAGQVRLADATARPGRRGVFGLAHAGATRHPRPVPSRAGLLRPDREPRPPAVSVTAVSTPGSRLAIRRRRLAAACARPSTRRSGKPAIALPRGHLRQGFGARPLVRAFQM